MPLKSLRRMKFTTPAMASEPYTAEAPSFRISTRSMTATGIAERSAPPPIWLDNAYGATRLPLMSTRVRLVPKPRSEMPVKPTRPVPSPPASLKLPIDWLIGRRSSRSCAVVMPEFAMSCLLMTVTGSAPSPSTRLMLEPVTSILSLVCAVCWASAGAVATDTARPTPSVCARARESFFILGFIIETPRWCVKVLLSRDLKGVRLGFVVLLARDNAAMIARSGDLSNTKLSLCRIFATLGANALDKRESGR